MTHKEDLGVAQKALAFAMITIGTALGASAIIADTTEPATPDTSQSASVIIDTDDTPTDIVI